MNALETILKSRMDSIVKIERQIGDLKSAIGNASTVSVKSVYEKELLVKTQRYERLKQEVAALKDELGRQQEIPQAKPPIKR